MTTVQNALNLNTTKNYYFEMAKHLYKYGAMKKNRKTFEKKYGKEKGDYVYGAVVGKVKKEREVKKRQKGK